MNPVDALGALGVRPGPSGPRARVGIGTAFMPAFSLVTHGVEPRDAGVASAMTGAAQQIGGSIGTALLNTIATAGYLASHHTSTPDKAAPAHGYSVACWWATGFPGT